jgi:hypothetical protein
MNIKTLALKTTFLPDSAPHGWGNGYIGVPPEHPWFGKNYNDIECNCHGGLTYSADHVPKEKPDGHWWLGFDTCHLYDNKYNCCEAYVINEIELLKQQAIEIYEYHRTN